MAFHEIRIAPDDSQRRLQREVGKPICRYHPATKLILKAQPLTTPEGETYATIRPHNRYDGDYYIVIENLDLLFDCPDSFEILKITEKERRNLIEELLVLYPHARTAAASEKVAEETGQQTKKVVEVFQAPALIMAICAWLALGLKLYLVLGGIGIVLWIMSTAFFWTHLGPIARWANDKIKNDVDAFREEPHIERNKDEDKEETDDRICGGLSD